MPTRKTTPPIDRPPNPQTGLVLSTFSVSREKAVLRRGRERLEEEPGSADTSARTTLAARRTPSA